MIKGLLEGLVKPEVNIESNMDMSSKTGDTYNIEEIKIGNLIGNLIITDKEAAKELANVLLHLAGNKETGIDITTIGDASERVKKTMCKETGAVYSETIK